MAANPHLFRATPTSDRWQQLAEHLRQHPEALELALENLDRWQQWGKTHPEPIRIWRQRIDAARSRPQDMDALLQRIASADEDEDPMFSCSPFTGPGFPV